MVDALHARGHRAFAPTLTGVGERVHLMSPAITLETHVADVMNLIEAEELQQVVLAVHSYAGMIGTALADRATPPPRWPQPPLRPYCTAGAGCDGIAFAWMPAAGVAAGLAFFFIGVWVERRRAVRAKATAEALKFFAWAYKNGADMASSLDYIPMPQNVVEMIHAKWKSEIKGDGGKPIY